MGNKQIEGAAKPDKKASRLLFAEQESTRASPDTAAETKAGGLNIAADTNVNVAADNPITENTAQNQGNPERPLGKKAAKAQNKADKMAAKLGQARTKLPQRRKLTFKPEPKNGKYARKLRFAPETVSQAEHVKGARVTRPVKAFGNAAIAYGHKKLYQVEKENVGTEAAHRSELVAEGAVRSALYYRKTAPYRKVRRLEFKARKADINAAYQKALSDNPQLKSNPISRLMQKNKIKKEYAQGLREAKKGVSNLIKTGDTAAETVKKVLMTVKRHPYSLLALLCIGLLLITLTSAVSSCSNLVVGSGAMILTASYTAEDEDINRAELLLTKLEADLRVEIYNTPDTHPGYDVYIYDIDNIGHDPFKLMAFLTAVYGDFTYAQVQPVIRQLFNNQYQITYTESSETHTTTNSDGSTSSDTIYILTVTLTATSFADLIAPLMNSDQQDHYGILMETKGNRQYVDNPFTFNWLPYASSNYGYSMIPNTGIEELNQGIDIAVPQGTAIHAGFDGKVVFSGYNNDDGNYVIIQNSEGVTAKYAHCNTLSVTTGQTVKDGDVIATVGRTGNTAGPGLYLEISKGGQTLNPIYFALTGDDGSGNIQPGSPGGPIIPSDPGQPMSASEYQTLITYAEQYLGYPYAFGGSNPQTSFDCSGFVCWVFNQTGIASVGRTTAQGLFNMCTPVSPADAAPGDLVFFTGTYDAGTPVTHVGIYMGNGIMIAAGNPIQLTNITTSYWQQHYYSFGRL